MLVKECVNVSTALFTQERRESSVWEFVLSTIKHIKNKLIAYLTENANQCVEWKWFDPGCVGRKMGQISFFFLSLFDEQFFMTLVKLLMDFFDWICWRLKWNWKENLLKRKLFQGSFWIFIVESSFECDDRARVNFLTSCL